MPWKRKWLIVKNLKSILNRTSLIPAVKEKLNLLKKTIEDTQENYTLSKDRGAKTGHKSAESSFFGYKTHLAMTEERIITAAVVTSGEKGDGPELPKLLERSQGKVNRISKS
ncbi:MAG: family transposase [Mucilaginibacter sp.]|nr:family transposase [Mucilaginibacter sp.]